MSNASRTINKETQEAIRRFLTSNTSLNRPSPKTPALGLDPNFSRILQKKREEQLEASRQRLFADESQSESLVERKDVEKKTESTGAIVIKKEIGSDMNSSMFGKANQSWNDLSVGEDSFLALERQCNMEDKRDRILSADDTLLFDIEPPSELWNQTLNHSIVATKCQSETDLNKFEYDLNDSDELDKTEDEIAMSPVKYIGLIRPSTIIEETSSQFDSTTKSGSSSVYSSSYATASFNASSASNVSKKEPSIIDSQKETSLNKPEFIAAHKGNQIKRCNSVDENTKAVKFESKNEPFSQKDSNSSNRQRRGTFAFKRSNYTFFPDENLEPIDESASFTEDAVQTPIKDSQRESNPVTPKTKLDESDEFNNTLERVEYLLEKGKQIIEETPVAKRTGLHNSFLETPLFSCKRKRLLSEMASIEMLPLPKRGPLIDFSTPEVTKQRFSKFTDK